MMKTTIVAALAMGIGLCGFAPRAHAEEKKNLKDYTYEFPDDKLLDAGGQGTTPMIKVRGGARRDLLHRPRLQFVTELLKSVENM